MGMTINGFFLIENVNYIFQKQQIHLVIITVNEIINYEGNQDKQSDVVIKVLILLNSLVLPFLLVMKYHL